MALTGIDISNWQAGLDVSRMGVDVIICKATEGTSYVDPTCDVFFQAALKAGKKVGFYHFMDASADGRAQADFFVNNTLNYFGVGLPVLDYEGYGMIGAGNVLAFIERVHERTGVWCVLYMSKSVIYQDNWSEVAKRSALWFAQYADTNPTGLQTDPWTDDNGFSPFIVFGQQYTGTGRLDGYNGNLDLDVFWVDAQTWDKYVLGDRAIQTVETQAPRQAQVQLYTPNNTDAQKWVMEWVDKVTFKLKSKSCGLYLDVYGAGTENRTLVQVYESNDTVAQLWRMGEKETGDYTPSYMRPIHLIPVCAPDKRLDVDGGLVDDGSRVQIYEENQTVAQDWVAVPVGDYITLINTHSGKALDVVGGGN